MSKPILFITPSKIMMRNYERSRIWAKRLESIFSGDFSVAFIPEKMDASTEATSITSIIFKDDNVELSAKYNHDKDQIDSLICGLKYILDNVEQFKMELEKEEEESSNDN